MHPKTDDADDANPYIAFFFKKSRFKQISFRKNTWSKLDLLTVVKENDWTQYKSRTRGGEVVDNRR